LVWEISISQEGWRDLEEAIRMKDAAFLQEALLECGISTREEGEDLVSLTLQQIEESNTCEAGGYVYWIDQRGFYTIVLSD
jgi:hypothetical protein